MDTTSIMRGPPQLNNLRNNPMPEQVLIKGSHTKELVIIDSSFFIVSTVGSTWNCLSCIKHLLKTKSYITEQEKEKEKKELESVLFPTLKFELNETKGLFCLNKNQV